MNVYTIKKYGNGLHIVLSKKAYKEGQTVEIADPRTEKQTTAEPKEQIKQQKTPPLFIDKEIDYSKILLCMNGEVCSRDGSIINNRICADCHKKIYKPNP